MINTPVPEQSEVILSTGGVLLQAGAGSGKTYVLVEHLMVQIEKYLPTIKNLDPLNATKKIKAFLSSIVVMTFTQKAVGELEIRIKNKIKQKAQEEKIWELVDGCGELINITTIHGLCHQLLRSGILGNHEISEVQIVSQLEFERKIQRLFIQWFEQSAFDEQFKQQVILHEQQILAALINVFSNADLRRWWEGQVENPTPVEQEENLGHLLQLQNLAPLQHPWDFAGIEEKQKKLAWAQIVLGFNQLVDQVSLATIAGLLAAEKFFASIPRLIGPKNLPGAQEHFARFKLLRELVRNHQESLTAFQTDTGIFAQWQEFYRSIFCYLNNHYLDIPGISFADLEYYTFKYLGTSAAVEKVQSSFRYFIVDEFQDTSQVQFAILQKMVKSDFSNLLVVGDLKQAIYGFRGGELGVFLACQQKMPWHKELVNNYRSCQKVVEFNNHFFSLLFPLGPGFTGHDHLAVPMVKQVPIQTGGSITRLVCNIKVAEKLSALEYDSTEALLLVTKIKQLRTSAPDLQICVLYRKISPSLKLITLLVQEQIPFAAQVKIPLSDDPLWNIFLWANQLLVDKDGQERVYGELIHLTLEHLHFNIDAGPAAVVEKLQKYRTDVQYYGLEIAFTLLVLSLEISNSNYQSNWDLVVLVIKMCQEDPMQILQAVKEQEDHTYLLDLKFLEQADELTIMTAHGAKGLEFDVVLLGGIYTNGKSKEDQNFLGTFPGSFRWKKELAKKNTFLSPQMLYEETFNKRKNFSEMKRLLYVACTRAKSQLIWSDIITEYAGDQFIGKDSWAHAFKLYREQYPDAFVNEMPLGDLPRPTMVEVRSAIYQRDNLGLLPTLNQALSGILPELSVTRLTDVIDCPRKFYLMHLLKLELQDKNPQIHKSEKFSAVEVSSSAERGVFLHRQLEKMIQNNLQIGPDDPNFAQLKWVQGYLLPLQESYHFSPEYSLKFSLEGMMITGTIDLLACPKVEKQVRWKIIDFKSGACSELEQMKYWYQLSLYGWGIGQRHNLQELILEIVALDQQKIFQKILTREQIVVEIHHLLRLAQTPEQISCHHCPICPYQQLCQIDSCVGIELC